MKRSGYVNRLPHLTIGVLDLKKSMSFYQDILGLEKLGEWPTYAMFDIAGTTLCLEAKKKLEICLLVENVDEAYRHLKDKGDVCCRAKRSALGWSSRTCLDPDGNSVMIESFHCKVGGKASESCREFLEGHLKKHKQ